MARLWPSLLAYVVSFSTIGASWLGHNAITEYLDRANATFVRLNLLLLLLIAFLPFPTRLFADYIGKDQPERVASTIYGVSLLLSSTLLWVLWRYAVHAQLVRPDAADEDIQFLTQRLTPGLAGVPGPDRGRAVRPGHRRGRVPGHRAVLRLPVPALRAVPRARPRAAARPPAALTTAARPPPHRTQSHESHWSLTPTFPAKRAP